MNPKQIEDIQRTFKLVAPIKDKAASLFYQKLFELNPSLRPLFKSDIEEQGRKLMAAIGSVVSSLRHLDRVIPVLQKLGRKHVDYGVADEDYNTVAEALLWALEQGLGAEFTPDVKQAWTEAYLTVADVMMKAAHDKQFQDEFIELLSMGQSFIRQKDASPA